MKTTNKQEEMEVLVSMVLDLVSNTEIKNGDIVRTLMLCISLVAVQNDVSEETVISHFRNVYKKISIALGKDTWLPPAES